jgi:hypothetical protein
MEALTSELAHKTVKNYSCSNCWGDLEIVSDMRGHNMYFVICPKCKDDTKGYITKYFVNQRRAESEFEKRDVVRLLQKLEILPKTQTPLLQGETRQQANIRELGF